jgi:hypothetical protein
MKSILAFVAMAAFAVTAGAQTNAGASEAGNAGAQAGQMAASANQATNVSAELTKNLDSKNAKVGEEVLAKTTNKATLADGTKLPKGSRLIGHVTEAQAKSREQKDAQLAFTFDHAVLRDGREIPIHAVMRSLTAPAALSGAADTDSMMDAGGGMAPAGGGGMARGGGGGLVGGATGAVRGTAGTAGGMAGNAATGLDAGAQGTLNGAGQMGAGQVGANGTALGNAGLGHGTGPNGGAGLGGDLTGAAMPVGNLSGVTFATVNAAANAGPGGVNGTAGGSTTTLLTARGRNFSLDSGSQMTLSLSPQ